MSTKSFEGVNAKISQTTQLVTEIKNAMYEQSAGSRQIVEALKMMNDSTVQVKDASRDMAMENQQILREVNTLLNATEIIKKGMAEMLVGAKE